MNNPICFRREIWLLDYLLRRGKATRKEIERAWLISERTDGKVPTRQTLKADIERIASLFGIVIEVKRGYQEAIYSISNPEVLRTDRLVRWLVKILQTRDNVLLCTDIFERVILEDFPSEHGMFLPIIRAMKNNRKIEIVYKRYRSSEGKTHLIDPYCIKTYKHRYYVLGKFDNGTKCMFSFDRIDNLTLTKEVFEMDPDFDAEEYFKKYYGVFFGSKDSKEEIVVIRAFDDEPDYLLDVPLHHSQYIIDTTDNYTDFGILIVPTRDLVGDILQQGDRLEIIEPNWLRKIAIDSISRMSARYHCSM